MAERRMFAKTIVLSDAFLDMPMSARCFYFTLGMFADDDGFVNNPKAIMRQCGASIDDMNVLLAKKFVLLFEDGVIVIKHWRINNYLRNDRYVQTKYTDDKALLTLEENGAYTMESGVGIPSVGIPKDGIPSIGKDRIVEDRLEEVRVGKEKKENEDTNVSSQKKKFTPPTVEEVDDFCYENNLGIDASEFVDFYTANGWMVGKNHMKDWKATARNWDRKRKKDTGSQRFMTKREQAIKDYNDQLQMMADWARGDNVND